MGSKKVRRGSRIDPNMEPEVGNSAQNQPEKPTASPPRPTAQELQVTMTQSGTPSPPKPTLKKSRQGDDFTPPRVTFTTPSSSHLSNGVPRLDFRNVRKVSPTATQNQHNTDGTDVHNNNNDDDDVTGFAAEPSKPRLTSSSSRPVLPRLNFAQLQPTNIASFSEVPPDFDHSPSRARVAFSPLSGTRRASEYFPAEQCKDRFRRRTVVQRPQLSDILDEFQMTMDQELKAFDDLVEQFSSRKEKGSTPSFVLESPSSIQSLVPDTLTPVAPDVSVESEPAVCTLKPSSSLPSISISMPSDDTAASHIEDIIATPVVVPEGIEDPIRMRICQEILDTERSYIDALDAIIQIFIVPLRTYRIAKSRPMSRSFNAITSMWNSLRSRSDAMTFTDSRSNVDGSAIDESLSPQADNTNTITGNNTKPRAISIHSNSEPLVSHRTSPTTAYSTDGELIITSQQLGVIFLDIESFHSMHSNFFLPDIAKSYANKGVGIGDFFTRMSPSLKLYIGYIKMFDQSLDMIERVEKENPRFHTFLEEAYVMLGNRDSRFSGLRLADMLVKPFQRITKYKLLLRELQLRTDKNCVEAHDLETAIGTLDEVMGMVNERRRNFEKEQQLLQLSEELKIPDLVAPQRLLLHNATIRAARNGQPIDNEKIELYILSDIFLVQRKNFLGNPEALLLPFSSLTIDDLTYRAAQPSVPLSPDASARSPRPQLAHVRVKLRNNIESGASVQDTGGGGVIRLFKGSRLSIELVMPTVEFKDYLCRLVYMSQKDIDKEVVGSRDQPLFCGVPYGMSQVHRTEFTPLTIVVVGSPSAGKTALIGAVTSYSPSYMNFDGHISFRTKLSDERSFFQKPFTRMSHHSPLRDSPFRTMPFAVGSTLYNVTLWDTYGREDDILLRGLNRDTWRHANVVVLCVSLVIPTKAKASSQTDVLAGSAGGEDDANSESLVEEFISSQLLQWSSNIKDHLPPNIPVVLVGTHADYIGRDQAAQLLSRVQAKLLVDVRYSKEGLGRVFLRPPLVCHALRTRETTQVIHAAAEAINNSTNPLRNRKSIIRV